MAEDRRKDLYRLAHGRSDFSAAPWPTPFNNYGSGLSFRQECFAYGLREVDCFALGSIADGSLRNRPRSAIVRSTKTHQAMELGRKP